MKVSIYWTALVYISVCMHQYLATIMGYWTGILEKGSAQNMGVSSHFAKKAIINVYTTKSAFSANYTSKLLNGCFVNIWEHLYALYAPQEFMLMNEQRLVNKYMRANTRGHICINTYIHTYVHTNTYTYAFEYYSTYVFYGVRRLRYIALAVRR